MVKIKYQSAYFKVKFVSELVILSPLNSDFSKELKYKPEVGARALSKRAIKIEDVKEYLFSMCGTE